MIVHCTARAADLLFTLLRLYDFNECYVNARICCFSFPSFIAFCSSLSLSYPLTHSLTHSLLSPLHLALSLYSLLRWASFIHSFIRYLILPGPTTTSPSIPILTYRLRYLCTLRYLICLRDSRLPSLDILSRRTSNTGSEGRSKPRSEPPISPFAIICLSNSREHLLSGPRISQ